MNLTPAQFQRPILQASNDLSLSKYQEKHCVNNGGLTEVKLDSYTFTQDSLLSVII